MLQEAPVGPAQKTLASRSSQQLMNPAYTQGRSAGGAPGMQGNQLPNQQPLQRLQNHIDMTRRGAQDPVQPTQPTTPTPPVPATPSPGAFGTPFDREIGELDYSNPEAVQELMTRMNQAIVDNQKALDKQNTDAEQGLPAPNQDSLGRTGANLGKQRNYVQSQQM